METTTMTDPYAALDEVFDRLAGRKARDYDLRVTPEQLERLVEGLLALDDPEDRALGRRLRDAAREARTIDLTEEPEPYRCSDCRDTGLGHAGGPHAGCRL